MNRYERRDLDRLQEALFEQIDVSNRDGLEIGPLDRPLVSRLEGSVRYVDYFDEEVLRARCAANPNRDAERVVPLDYVLAGDSLAAVVDRTFDYIVASHVVEHVPNLLGWLRDIHGLLRPGGKLFVVAPDRRYCFDRDRSPTSLGGLLEDDYLDREAPSPRVVFDYHYHHRHVKPSDLWNDPAAWEAAPRTSTAQQALARFEDARTRYIDCHCNVFSCREFRELLAGALDLGVQPFDVSYMRETEPPFLDFIAILS